LNKTKLIVFAAIALGFMLISKPVYFYGKGILAESLIQDAWEKTKVSQQDEKPWGWADIHPVGHISIPAVGISHIVLDNISGQSLAFGPGHLSNSATPGASGNIVIAGHRDSFFRPLKDIKVGDMIKLESKYNTQYYDVREIVPTHANDIYWAEDTDYDCITLITCYPFNYIGEAEERFIVRARVVE
tara:strand:- start:165 stop:725 length:561 start_codon:yes stop_codon:yes gene_type:complete